MSLAATYGWVVTQDCTVHELTHGHPERVLQEWKDALASGPRIIEIWDNGHDRKVMLLSSEIVRVTFK